MFPGYQERDDYEDELYGQDEDDDHSGTDSELEFRLYSQLHYSTDDHEVRLDKPREPQPERTLQPPAPPAELIVITDSGPDILTISEDDDDEEEEDSVCARKCQRPPKKTPPHGNRPRWNPQEDIVILDSGSDRGARLNPLPPYVVDLGSDSDSDSLQSWMVLGKDKEDGDQDIQLNVLPTDNRYQPGESEPLERKIDTKE